MMAESPSALAFGQTSAARVSSPYSMRNTGLLAPMNGEAGAQSVSSQVHSTAQSKSATRS